MTNDYYVTNYIFNNILGKDKAKALFDKVLDIETSNFHKQINDIWINEDLPHFILFDKTLKESKNKNIIKNKFKVRNYMIENCHIETAEKMFNYIKTFDNLKEIPYRIKEDFYHIALNILVKEPNNKLLQSFIDRIPYEKDSLWKITILMGIAPIKIDDSIDITNIINCFKDRKNLSCNTALMPLANCNQEKVKTIIIRYAKKILKSSKKIRKNQGFLEDLCQYLEHENVFDENDLPIIEKICSYKNNFNYMNLVTTSLMTLRNYTYKNNDYFELNVVVGNDEESIIKIHIPKNATIDEALKIISRETKISISQIKEQIKKESENIKQISKARDEKCICDNKRHIVVDCYAYISNIEDLERHNKSILAIDVLFWNYDINERKFTHKIIL